MVVKHLWCVAFVAGCGSSAPPEPAPGCNPLIGDDCLTPFPSSVYETTDSTTATGVRVAIDDRALPVPHGTAPLTAARLNAHDGISPSTGFVVYFKDGVDATQLPTLDTLDQSVTAASAVQVIDYATGARVPVFAELDANLVDQNSRQGLLIRPMVRLATNTRYVIALVGLRDASGHALDPSPFAALRDGGDLSSALSALKPRYDEIFAALESAGVSRGSLTLAWDITTASEQDLTSHLVAMRDQALPMVPSLQWTITSSTDTPSDPDRYREIVGTFEVPSFLTDDTLTATMLVDAAGNPMLRDNLGVANFVVEIPACATTANGPLPVMVFGHGLFGNAHDELDTAIMKQVGNYLCMVEIGTDWIGLDTDDYPVLADNVLPNFNNLHITTDRLQQAHVNAQVLTRLVITRMKADPALALTGGPVIDGSQVYYYGISDGGIQGGTFMALSEDVTRGVLNVPGCEWTLMMFRSSDFAPLQQLLQFSFADPLSQQELLAMIQPEFDFTDPASFAPHLLADPLPTTPPKQILVQESIDDAQVPNIATRVLVRTIGLPGMDLVEPVFGVTEQAAPLPSAYTQWDVMPTPPPVGDTPAPEDNGAHEAIRRLIDLQAQLKAFFTPTGQVTQTCTGPCTCDLAAGTCEEPPGV